jgi:4-hydroxy-tetrahydrodipicolinate synthase
MKAAPDAKGVYVIAPTPFHTDGRIDESSIDRMCDFFVKAGVDGMTILGQLGEAPKMSHEESVGIVKRVMSRVKLPIVVGVSAPGFAAMRALTQDVMALGASGVMIAPPNTLRTDDSIVQYYKQASEAIGSDVPFVIQDYPLTFSVQMTPAVIRRIHTDNASCWFLKHEDWPGLEKISQLRAWEKEGSLRRLPILIGNNGLFLISRWSGARMAPTPDTASPTCWWTSCASRSRASATKPTIFSMPTCRSSATSSSPARASRCAST